MGVIGLLLLIIWIAGIPVFLITNREYRHTTFFWISVTLCWPLVLIFLFINDQYNVSR